MSVNASAAGAKINLLPRSNAQPNEDESSSPSAPEAGGAVNISDPWAPVDGPGADGSASVDAETTVTPPPPGPDPVAEEPSKTRGGGGGGAAVLNRLSLTLGGGYTLGGENFGPYIKTFDEWSDNAAHHRGGGFFAQPGAVIIPGQYNLIAGGDFAFHILRSKPVPGATQSDLNILSLGGFVTTNLSFIKDKAGLGASIMLGAAQVRSNGLDVGAPSLEGGELPTARDWTLNLGAQLYFQALQGGIKLGAEVRGQPINLPVTDNGESVNTTAKIAFPPITLFVGINALRLFVRN